MEETLKILKALSDKTRLKIIEFLIDGEKCVCEIIPCTKRTQSTVSIQLGKLERAGIVKSRRDGKKVFYSLISKKAKEVIKVMDGK